MSPEPGGLPQWIDRRHGKATCFVRKLLVNQGIRMPNTEIYNDKVVRQFLLAAAVWGIVGMSVGVLAAAQLAWPRSTSTSPG